MGTLSIPGRGIAILLILLWSALPPLATATGNTGNDDNLIEIFAGVSFAQIDFTFEGAEDDNTTYGVAFVDHAAVAAQLPLSCSGCDPSDWYLNIIVYDPPNNTPRWAVQNLPLVDPAVMDGASTLFSLLPEITGARSKVAYLLYEVWASTSPLDSMPAPTAPLIYAMPAENQAWNAAGWGAPPNQRLPDLKTNAACPSIRNGKTTKEVILIKNNQKSVQQDINQCVPGAVSNSLQYLCDIGTCGDALEGLDKRPGINGAPPESRVGKLDVRMGRAQGAPIYGDQALRGKLDFLCQDWGMDENSLVVNYQGDFCPKGDSCPKQNNKCYCGNAKLPLMRMCTVKQKNLTITATANGAPSIDFIRNAITVDKADLEMTISYNRVVTVTGLNSSEHVVHVVSYAKVGGRDFIRVIQDSVQGNNKRGVAYSDKGILAICLQQLQNGMVAVPNFPGAPNAIVTNLMEEYPKKK